MNKIWRVLGPVCRCHLSLTFKCILVSLWKFKHTKISSMSQSAWIRGPVCGVDNCRSRLYRSTDGMKVCQYGHVMDGNVEINDEQDENFVTTRRLNIQLPGEGGGLRGPTKSGISGGSQNETKRVYGSEARRLYLLCVQLMMKKQMTIIAKNYLHEDVQDELEEVVKLLWLRYLEHLVNSEKATETGASGGDRSVDVKKDGYKLPTMLDVIAIVYLANMWVRGSPLYVSDLLEGIRSNRIPYVRCLHLLPKSYIERLPSFYFQMLQPPSLPSENSIYSAILDKGAIVFSGSEKLMDVATDFYYPLVFRLLSDVLLLPNAPVLFCILVDLNSRAPWPLRLWFKPPTRRKSYRLIRYPDVQVAAMVIFVVKSNFIYNLSPVDYDSWAKALSKHELYNEYSFSSFNKSELVDWSDFKTNKYCEWVYENLIPKKNKTSNNGAWQDSVGSSEREALGIAEKRLFDIFDFDYSSDSPPGTATSQNDNDKDSKPTQLSSLDLMLDMMKKSNSQANFSLQHLNSLEEKLFTKLPVLFGVEKDILYNSYLALETHVKENLLVQERP